jgi:uncharacterized membrane protein
MLNEKIIAIAALVVLGVAEFGYCYYASQTPQNIGIIVGALAGLVGNTMLSDK